MKNKFLLISFVSLIAIALAACAPVATDSMTTTTAGTTITMVETTMTTTTMTASETHSEPSMITYKDLTPAEAKVLIDTTPDLIIIDVSPRYADGHLPGAVNYYVGDGTLDKVIPTLDKSKPYFLTLGDESDKKR